MTDGIVREPEDGTQDLDQASPPIARPASCAARADDDLMICSRCGLEWLLGAPGPKCDPITFERLRRRILTEVRRAEQSLGVLHLIRRDGGPADTEDARRRFVELDALQRLVERATLDPQMRDLLNGKQRGRAPHALQRQDPAGGRPANQGDERHE